MPNKTPDPKKIESIVCRIITFYIESAEGEKADDLILYLGGGKIPEPSVQVLSPILQSLTDEDAAFGSTLTPAHFKALEKLQAESETLYKTRAATRTTLKKTINSPEWSKVEKSLATRFGSKLLKADDRMLDLLAHEVALSDFTVEQILSTFQNDSANVLEFSGRWYADCNNRDYPEEWDPAEGNQQEDNPADETLGMAQGFVVSYIILYLYAANSPDGIAAFYKRQKLAQGKQVAKDVSRIYRQVTKKKGK